MILNIPALDLGSATVRAVNPPASALEVFNRSSHLATTVCADVLGLPELRSRFADVLGRLTGWAPPIENIAVIPGSSAYAMGHLFRARLKGKQDEAISWTPQWFGYRELLSGCHGSSMYATINLGTKEGFRPSAATLRKYAGNRLSLVIVPDLVNPVGVKLSDHRLASIFSACYEKPDALVLHDQHFLFNVERPNRSVYWLCRELWDEERYVGMTSLRLGFALEETQSVAFCWGPRRWLMQFGNFLKRNRLLPGLQRQRLALECLSDEGLDTPKQVRAAAKVNRAHLDALIREVPQLGLVGRPEEGPHVLLDFSRIGGEGSTHPMNDRLFMTKLYMQGGVHLLSCSAFIFDGVAGRVNLSAVPEVRFLEGLQRIRSFLSSNS